MAEQEDVAWEILEEETALTCDFCRRSTVNPRDYGPLFQLGRITAHHYCLMFSAGVRQAGQDDEGILGFLPEDIKKELQRGRALRCRFCQKNNATVGCCVRKCRYSYHFPCGLEHGFQFQFLGDFESYCPEHMDHEEIPEDDPSLTWDCPICLCQVGEGESPIWTPCCRKGVFHKSCIFNMAQHHGLEHFKCPLCNDKEVFSVAVRKAGVHLPDRDASWEVEPAAFQEHQLKYDKCDAEECSCPGGRVDCPGWEVVLCGGCTASGIHKKCGKLKSLTWRCATCAPILGGKGGRGQKTGSKANAAGVARPSVVVPPLGLQPRSGTLTPARQSEPQPDVPVSDMSRNRNGCTNFVSSPPTNGQPLRTLWVTPETLFMSMRPRVVLPRLRLPTATTTGQAQGNRKSSFRIKGHWKRPGKPKIPTPRREPEPEPAVRRRRGHPKKKPDQPQKQRMSGEALSKFRRKTILLASLRRLVNRYKRGKLTKCPNLSVGFLPILEVRNDHDGSKADGPGPVEANDQ